MTDVYIKMLEHLINGEKSKAKALFKQVALSEGRTMLREFLEEENMASMHPEEDMDENMGDLEKQVEAEEYFTNEDMGDEEAEGESVDDLLAGDEDAVSAEAGEEAGEPGELGDLPGEEGGEEGEVDRLMNIEDELQELIDKFETMDDKLSELVGEEGAEEEASGEEAEDMGAEEEDMGAEEEDMGAEEEAAGEEGEEEAMESKDELGDFDDLEESFYTGLEKTGEMYKSGYSNVDGTEVGGKKMKDKQQTESNLSGIETAPEKRAEKGKPIPIGKGPIEKNFEWNMSPNYLRDSTVKQTMTGANTVKTAKLDDVKGAKEYAMADSKTDGKTIGTGNSDKPVLNTKSLIAGKKKNTF